MKKLLFSLVSALLLTGCMHHYDITLVNGMQITHVSRPKLDKTKGVYTYTDMRGKKKTISASRVVEIGPHQKHPNVPGTAP